MKRKLLLSFCCLALLVTFLPSTVAPAKAVGFRDPLPPETLAVMESLIAAGRNAGAVWTRLPEKQRDIVRSYLGRTGDIVAAFEVPQTQNDAYVDKDPLNPFSAESFPIYGTESMESPHKYRVENVKLACEFIEEELPPIRQNGPGSLQYSVEQTLSSHWEANVGLDLKVVSAGVGFGAEQQFSVNTTFTYDMKDSHIYEMDFYSRWYWYTFDIYDYQDVRAYAGDGSAYRYRGYFAYVWKVD